MKRKRRGRYAYISYWWNVWKSSTWENKTEVGDYGTYLGSCLVSLFYINSVKPVPSTGLSRFVDCLLDVRKEIKENECRFNLLDK